MKRLYLALDDRLYEAIDVKATELGMSPTSLVTGNLESIYLRERAVNYQDILVTLFNEAQNFPQNEPFTLADLPSYAKLILSSSNQAQIMPSPLRARIGKTFNVAVRNGRVPGVVRAKRKDIGLEKNPEEFLNRSGTAMYIRK